MPLGHLPRFTQAFDRRNLGCPSRLGGLFAPTFQNWTVPVGDRQVDKLDGNMPYKLQVNRTKRLLQVTSLKCDPLFGYHRPLVLETVVPHILPHINIYTPLTFLSKNGI